MRSLGVHCNVIGDVNMLEQSLYHHTYFAVVMQQARAAEGKKDRGGNNVILEFSFSTCKGVVCMP
jgi:hypothetical protein